MASGRCCAMHSIEEVQQSISLTGPTPTLSSQTLRGQPPAMRSPPIERSASSGRGQARKPSYG
eukprot:scaffold52956_cov17-Prasinocladus_malaysianus.AAC.1